MLLYCLTSEKKNVGHRPHERSLMSVNSESGLIKCKRLSMEPCSCICRYQLLLKLTSSLSSSSVQSVQRF